MYFYCQQLAFISILVYSALVQSSDGLYHGGPYKDATTDDKDNSTENVPKDLYVIHAMVYEVGILTNGTDNNTEPEKNEQVQLTFYNGKHNGSGIDLDNIPMPIQTNVSGRIMTGIAPVNLGTIDTDNLPAGRYYENAAHKLSKREDNSHIPTSLFAFAPSNAPHVQSVASMTPLNGSIQSLSIPPLLSLNISEIPIPLPNTSVLRYSRVQSSSTAVNGTVG